MEHSDYRLVLKEALADRLRSRPRYSVRKLARDFGMAHSSLSSILRGKSNLSPSNAYRVAGSLGLNPSETEYFCLLVQEAGARDETAKSHLKERILKLSSRRSTQRRQLNMSQFRAVSDWHSFAILGVACLPGFQFEPKAVAEKLGIAEVEAEVSIARLLRLGLLKKDENGKITRIPDDIFAVADKKNGIMNRHHHAMLRKTGEAIEKQDYDERVSGFDTLPIDRALVPQARTLIEECFSRVEALSMESPNKTDVDHLSIHLFNLTPARKDPRS